MIKKILAMLKKSTLTGLENRERMCYTGQVKETIDREYTAEYGYVDVCVSCGRPVPEGRMVCLRCENGDKL